MMQPILRTERPSMSTDAVWRRNGSWIRCISMMRFHRARSIMASDAWRPSLRGCLEVSSGTAHHPVGSQCMLLGAWQHT